jgi:hypothetical protein
MLVSREPLYYCEEELDYEGWFLRAGAAAVRIGADIAVCKSWFRK